VPGEPKEGTSSHYNPKLLIHYSVHALAVRKYEVSSLSTVFDAVTAVAHERTVISYARSLNRLSAGG